MLQSGPTAYIIIVALFGAIIGSFLNALSFRFNTGRSLLKSMSGRSRCMHCGHALSALDLVPVFSFAVLRGRCRYCHSRISWQYPIVEAAAAILCVLVYLNNPAILVFSFQLLIWMTLLFVVIYDIRHGIIPWSCSGLLAVLALGSLFLTSAAPFPGLASGWALAAGPLLALPLFLTSLISRGAWMGWGDSALELSLGWLLGLSAGVTALMLAFWSGALVGVGLLALSRAGFFRYTIKSELPFAPFLVLGAALSYFFHVDFFSTISLF